MLNTGTRREALLSALTGVVAVAASYAAAGQSPAFVMASIDQQVVSLTPGPVVTFSIENIGEPAHLLHLGLSLGIAIGLFGLVTFAGRRAADRFGVGAAVAAAGAVGWLLALGLGGDPVLAAAPAVPTALGTAIGRRQPTDAPPDRERRWTLRVVASAFGLSGLGVLAGDRLHSGSSLERIADDAGAGSRLGQAEAKALDVSSESLHGLVSPIERFYNVDIAEFAPDLTAEEWSVTVTGELERERELDYADLTDQPTENRFVTLRCVGEGLNGHKLDTAVWTGTPIRPLLDSVDPTGECDCVTLHGEDDYFVQFPREVLAEGFLAWGMNGRVLPPAHGHPVRVLIPGHWGETNVKWLSEIELLDTAEPGYWEQRGWEGTGEVNTVAKLWDEGITELDDGRIELAGHAYAGTRGVRRVEVSTDGGDSWTDATLSEPLPDADVWRQWRYTFEPSGSHEVVVRATDGTGALQPKERSDPAPTGSTGWVRRTVSG